MGQISPNTSGVSLSNNQQQGQQTTSHLSMNTLQGGGGGASSSNNWGNNNSMGQVGGGGGGGGGPPGNPMAMNAILADYLRRTGGPAPNGEGGGGENVIKEEGSNMTEAFC